MCKGKLLTAIVSICIAISVSNAANTIYVDSNSPNDPGSGTYEDPFRRIQNALDYAAGGDAILIQPGTYTGIGNYNLDPGGKAVTIQCSNPNDSDIVAQTIIDANYADRGFYFHQNEDANCILAGLTIKNCSTTGSGAAICCENSSPTVRNCIISSNSSIWGAGAILLWLSDSTISNCIIADNTTKAKGGAVWLVSSNASIINCTIAANSATLYGGGIHCSESTLHLANSILWDNVAGSGAQLSLSTSSSFETTAWVRYCDIQGGQTEVDAGSGCTLQWEDNNLDIEPNFARFDPNGDPNIWDFHLQSAYGRWGRPDADLVEDGFIDLRDFAAFASFWHQQGQSLPADFDNSGIVDWRDFGIIADSYLTSETCGAWVFDDVTSPCIDAGDPNSDWAAETWNNGKRINLGAYGGTQQASMSGNPADFNLDGSVSFIDFAYLADKWAANETCIEDLDRDGNVGILDIRMFCSNWLRQK